MKKLCVLILTLMTVAALVVPAGATAGASTVYAGTVEELKAALKSNTVIILEGKDYNVGELTCSGLENVTIQGTGSTRLINHNGGEVILALYNCREITLRGLVMGHDIPADEACTAGVIQLGSTDLLIDGCDIYGCGKLGIFMTYAERNEPSPTLIVKNSVIRDCSECIMFIGQRNTAIFENSLFSGNGYRKNRPWAVECETGSELTFTQCIFKDNQTSDFFGGFFPEGRACTLNNCYFSGNSWPGGDTTPADRLPDFSLPTQTSTQPAAGDSSAKTAYASTQNVQIDGKPVTFEAYALKDASGNDTNYIKLRDVAQALNGTRVQFQVGWENAVTISTGQAYTPNGTEMKTPYSGDRTYQDVSEATLVDGSPAELAAIRLTDDGGNGYTYYGLRDLGRALDFYVGWSAEQGIFIDTNRPYQN